MAPVRSRLDALTLRQLDRRSTRLDGCDDSEASGAVSFAESAGNPIPVCEQGVQIGGGDGETPVVTSPWRS
jgi:hypothetical protein